MLESIYLCILLFYRYTYSKWTVSSRSRGIEKAFKYIYCNVVVAGMVDLRLFDCKYGKQAHLPGTVVVAVVMITCFVYYTQKGEDANIAQVNRSHAYSIYFYLPVLCKFFIKPHTIFYFFPIAMYWIILKATQTFFFVFIYSYILWESTARTR